MLLIANGVLKPDELALARSWLADARFLERAVVTSAMNPGLGGGPMLYLHGRVRAVVSLNLNEIGRFSLAIPAERFLDARDAFLAAGPTGMGHRPWLGVFCYTLADRIVVAGVMTGGPGERSGLLPGDVVVAVDGQPVSDRAGLYRRVWRHAMGRTAICATSIPRAAGCAAVLSRR